MHSLIRRCIFPLLLGLAALPAAAQAQTAGTPNQGFEINRYQPTAAGEWSFAVDHPWYSATRYFAAGITLNYAHKPLVAGSLDNNGNFSETKSLIDHHFLGHIDLAGSFLNRVLITASMPIVLASSGDPSFAAGASVGDPRLGVKARLYGEPYQDVFSASLGLDLWVPLRSFAGSIPPTDSDQGMRLLPKIMLGGVWNKLLWSGTFAFLYRPEAVTVAPAGFATTLGRAASELQFGLAASYFDQQRRFAIGPEIVITSAATGSDAFSRFGTSLEFLLGGQYNIAKMVQAGLALGGGFVRQPGTPDFRMLFRLSYAPMRDKVHDRDGDGILDNEDACPDVKGIRTGIPETHGCPPPGDRDGDGVLDTDDICPDVHQGARPDPTKRGCPVGDRDGDGVLDPDDLCPDTHKGPNPDPLKRGCPMGDRDGDGVLDPEDLCPDTHHGAVPDPTRRGCPAGDRDRDGVLDPQDFCPDQHMGHLPDPARLGCPQPDRDGDLIPDAQDACPDKPGSPNADKRKHGCPGGLAVIEHGQVKILKPVFFAFDKDVILPQSFPTLQAVADVLKATPTIRRLRIEGHTDATGNRFYNIDLSDRRAASVMRWLVQHGIEAARVYSQGFGPDRPIAPNTTIAGRAKNRRVEFHIVSGEGATTVAP